MVKLLASGLCSLLLVSCASKSTDLIPTLRVEGIVIENQTRAWVSAARLLVPVTGRFVSCGNIPPASMCSTTFPESAYAGNAVELTWSQGGQIHSTGEFALEAPDEVDRSRPVAVRIVIAAPGSAGAIIVQSPE